MLVNIKMTEKTYSRTDSGKSWKAQPDEVETRMIDEQQYNRITCNDTLQWFRRLGGSETATRCYTTNGYKIVELSSCSPDRSIKKVRTFDLDNATHRY